MFSLLIADDEKIIRESLANCLDWEEIGIRVVGCCANGLEALDCIIDESPDIVITDIKMPGLNGLELIGKMQNIDKEIEFIILSGFREFDFAKTAMELGVRRYLLKPVSEKEVLDAVLDAMKSCQKRSTVQAALADCSRLQSTLDSYHRSKTADASTTEPETEQEADNYLVQKVKHYVHQNLADSSLSLKKIATQYVHANPDYLSRLFVQQTGEKFSHYLNRKRVEKAKKLLQEDAGRIYLVAEQIGLGHNPRYFSQVFKKYVGSTPTAFIEAQEKERSTVPTRM